MIKTELDMETWNRVTAARGEEGRGNRGKKGKGLVKEYVWMTHGHGQWCGDWLWVGVRLGVGGQRWENWTTALE